MIENPFEESEQRETGEKRDEVILEFGEMIRDAENDAKGGMKRLVSGFDHDRDGANGEYERLNTLESWRGRGEPGVTGKWIERS